MKYFSGVGSRETPTKILHVIENLSYKLGSTGFHLRSGGADGADSAFQEGFPTGRKMEIYIPWNGFNNHKEGQVGIIVGVGLSNWIEAEKLAKTIHPAWEKLTIGAKALHTRNIYQVLGEDLSTPSKFLVCYAKPQGDSVQGGTRTAWEVAKMHHIPCFNLYDSATLERIQKYLEE